MITKSPSRKIQAWHISKIKKIMRVFKENFPTLKDNQLLLVFLQESLTEVAKLSTGSAIEVVKIKCDNPKCKRRIFMPIGEFNTRSKKTLTITCSQYCKQAVRSLSKWSARRYENDEPVMLQSELL